MEQESNVGVNLLFVTKCDIYNIIVTTVHIV